MSGFSFKRRPAPAAADEAAAGNPILSGRGAFAGAFGDLARGKRNWQLMAFGLLGLFGIVLVAFVRVAAETRITPYVVEVDKLGRAVAFGPAERTAQTDPRIVAATLALFVRNVRAVSTDGVVQRDLLYRAYANTAGKARQFLDGYFALPEHDPRLLGQRFTRAIEVGAILPVPGSAVWRVQWTEREQPVFAGPSREAAWEGYLTVKVHRPQTASVIEDNPLGIYVTDLAWTEVTKSQASGGAR
ncbi:MAG TPA: VirB8/TrbF family protein [Thermoanaerobaculia bacterium]|jgi:type IV secretion system protein VirB5|nr:VirB8/TrbF family protein [Thermoanaerobaculia bacterium]